MCVDPSRDVLVLFGGYQSTAATSGNSNDVWVYPLGADSVWIRHTVPGAGPSPRQGHAMVRAVVADRFAMFGGMDAGGLRQDLWLFNLAGSNGLGAWTPTSPAGPLPPVRFQHAMAYDPPRNRLLVFGGGGINGTNLLDVWAYSFAANAWSNLTPAVPGPSARRGSTMTYDATRDRMLVFGGQGVGLNNDVWALSLAGTPAWSALTPSGAPPAARVYHAAAFDPAGDALLVFGGNSASGPQNDVWRLSLTPAAAWSLEAPAGPPPAARLMTAAAVDPARDRILFFGGASNAEPALSDLWALDHTGALVWSRQRPQGEGLVPRLQHSMIVDPLRDRIIVFGGQGASDTWTVPLGNESDARPLSAGGITPKPRYGHAAIYDPVRDRMLVLGGSVIGVSEGEVLELTLGSSPAWAVVPTSGTPPLPRTSHSATYVPGADRVIVIGGTGPGLASSEVCSPHPARTPTSTRLFPVGPPPPPFYSHVAVLDAARNRIVIHVADLVYTLTLSDPPVWSQHFPQNMPPSRNAHAGVRDPLRNRLVIFGGDLVTGTEASDCWALSLDPASLQAWTQLAPEHGPPSGRRFHAAVSDASRDRMLIFGGGPVGVGLGPSADALWSLGWSPVLDVEGPDDRPRLPGALSARPNPARDAVALEFHLAREQEARLQVTDVQGRRVTERALGRLAAGAQRVEWDGRDAFGRAPAGIYFCSIETASESFRQRVVLLPR